MEKVTLFAVLYDGNIVELKASIGDAIRFIYEEEFEQEFASNIVEDSQPAANEVSEFIASFVSNLNEGDNDSLVFRWWKISPIPVSAEVLAAINKEANVAKVQNDSLPDEEDAALNEMIEQYEAYEGMSAEADYYAHCDDIWQIGGSI